MDDWIAADWPAPANIVAGTTLRTNDLAELPPAGKPCWLHQVHGPNTVVAGKFDTAPEADGSAGDGAEYYPVINTADCLPVLMCSCDGSVVGAAHAGWRGLAAGVIENTVAQLDVDADDLLVWLGPAISQPSFEVGADVRAAFLEIDRKADSCFEVNSRGRWQADLYALARQRLSRLGITNVSGGGFCTYLDDERFFSYRRDPGCGRLVTFVGRKAP